MDNANEVTPVTTEMNVWAKLLAVRNEFYAIGARKSGVNNHSEFMYFELSDIVPTASRLFSKYNMLYTPTFGEGTADGILINIDKPAEQIMFKIPVQFIKEPAKFRMNEVQGVGAAVTYYRRYLYMLVLDLIEADSIDSGENRGVAPEVPKPEPEARKKPATAAERSEIKASLTNTSGTADEMQIKALKKALLKLRQVDSEQEEFIQELAKRTKGFTVISRESCEKLIMQINELIDTCEKSKGE